MKKFAFATTLALVSGSHARASVMEIVAGPDAVRSGLSPAQAMPQEGIAVLQAVTSDLAEPAVIAMMVLGLCLIGYRARRDSSETFK